MLNQLSHDVRQYLLVTANYWAFTLTDGALRMLIIFHFHTLGYSPLEIAFLFLFYETLGVVTNLFGGWLGAHWGLNRTMNIGLFSQIGALAMLSVPAPWLSVLWLMVAQGISGVAKDLNKMSAKSAIKLLVPHDAQGILYRWVARLTGSKNALKGVGFFLGGVLLGALGFRGAVIAMAVALGTMWMVSLLYLKNDLGRSKNKAKFTHIFSKSRAINALSAARLFLFAARDVWFVVALPVFLSSQWGWDYSTIGALLALWVIGYGAVQAMAPRITHYKRDIGQLNSKQHRHDGTRQIATRWASILTVVPLTMAAWFSTSSISPSALLLGLALFGIIFAINSSLHSYLIIRFAESDGVSLDVGFYYMANAAGRLFGTLLSGWVYQTMGLTACLWLSALMIAITSAISWRYLPNEDPTPSQSTR